MTSNHEVNTLIAEQLGEWAQACDNYAALADVKVKEFDVDGMHFKVQFNPARAVSSGAKGRCSLNQGPQMLSMCRKPTGSSARHIMGKRVYHTRKPLSHLPRHLTIPDNKHVPQVVEGSVSDMLQLASELSDYTVFYNGARCGASAPDHFHFQAGNSDFLPLADNLEGIEMKEVTSHRGSTLYLVDALPIKMFVIDADTPQSGNLLFTELIHAMPKAEEDMEPMLNLLAYATPTGTRLVVVPRKSTDHRSTVLRATTACCSALQQLIWAEFSLPPACGLRAL